MVNSPPPPPMPTAATTGKTCDRGNGFCEQMVLRVKHLHFCPTVNTWEDKDRLCHILRLHRKTMLILAKMFESARADKTKYLLLQNAVDLKIEKFSAILLRGGGTSFR